MTAVWKFRPFQRGDTLRNPVTANFFAQEAIEDPAEALVRESIQNSLDARHQGARVIVRFGIVARGPTDPQYLAQVFSGLEPHLASKDNGLEERPDIRTPARFAVVEDFGTTGLEGDPGQWVPQPGTRNDFFSFFRAEGHTDKGDEDRGRWGVGKTVFPRSSEANTFFALTVRRSDGKTLLMGRGILKGHKVGNQQFHPDGYFGLWSDGLALPLEAAPDCDRFRRHFQLRRKQEPGLSVVVPLLQEDITLDALLRAVLRDYFYAILVGDLAVSIDEGSRSISLTADNLQTVAQEHGDTLGKELAGLIELAIRSRAIPEHRTFMLPCPPRGNGAQAWEHFAIDDRLRNAMRDALASGEPMKVRLGIRVRRKHGTDQESWADLILWQRDPADMGRPLFIREGIIVSNANGARARGVLSIVSVTDRPLATFLGDAENVAHTEWSADRANFQQRYVYAKATLRLVKDCVAKLVATVMAGREDRDPDLLREFFSFDIPQDSSGDSIDGSDRTPAKKRTPKPPPPQPHTPARYRITKIEGGFAVRRGEPEAPTPAGLIVKAAYDVRRGSPLKAYDPADFVLDTADFDIRPEGLEIKAMRANRIDLRVTAPDFALSVRGFDPYRDLFVSVEPIDSETSE